MASILGIGTSGLLAAQRQLATASHNISNVNTEGYSRQRAEQAARLPQFSGSGYIGSGVSVQSTVRLANEFLEEQIRNSNSQYGQFDAFHALSTQVDNILANPDSGLTPTLESFFSALQEAADNPSSTPARQVLITEAKTLTSRFKLLDDRFIELNSQVNQQLGDLTQEITDAARSIARLNVDIVQKTGAGQGDLPNDLIDQREVLIKKIAENIDVSVVMQDDGAANVFIGSGQSLVVGGTSSTLSTQINRYNAEDLDIILTQGAGIVDITNAVSGGELQGVLDFKVNVLESSRRSLGRIAVALSEEINHQHHLGMTLQDSGSGFTLGGDFFTSLTNSPQVLPGQTASTGTYSSTIFDSKLLTTSDYRLEVTSGAPNTYTLIQLNNPSPPLVTGGTFAAVQAAAQAEGFDIGESVASTADESFLIRPTYSAIAEIDVVVNNVLDIALAGPVISGAVTNSDGSARNSGTASISLPVAATSVSTGILTDLPMAAPVTLDFEASNANEFDINLPATATVSYNDASGNPQTIAAPVTALPYNPATDSGGITYTVNYASGDTMTFTVQGVPSVNDQFELKENTAPYNDNRNGLLLASLQTKKTLENSSTDFQTGYGIIVSDVGTKTHSAEIDLRAQLTLSEQANAERESYSGVNLDEEAADLLKFQQSYQASARVISAADEMFQALLNSV